MSSISDVASAAGVSTSTVSNFLNGRLERMKEETRARIGRVVSELNYRPNAAARQLKTGRSPLLGLLVPSMSNPMYALLAREIEMSAQARYGLRVLMGNTHRDPRQESRFIDDMFTYGVKGMIVVSSAMDESHLEAAARRGLAIVSYDRRATPAAPSAVDHVTVDNHGAAFMATRSLIEQGHQDLGFVTLTGHTMSRDEKVRGFLDAARSAGLRRRAKVFYCGEPQDYGDSVLAQLGREQGQHFASSARRPSAVVAVNDLLAIGLIAGCRQAGLLVPDEMSVVGMDDVLMSRLIEPALTTVRFPISEIASKMVERLMARVDSADSPAEEFVFEPTLVMRDSVRTVRGGRAPDAAKVQAARGKRT